MSEIELLKAIKEAGSEDRFGFADIKKIKEIYTKPDFDRVYMLLHERGYLSRAAPVGSLSLSPSGEDAITRAG